MKKIAILLIGAMFVLAPSIKADQKVKDPFIFKTEPYRRDCSRLVNWCNPFESINKGKLGSTQNCRIEKPIRSYY